MSADEMRQAAETLRIDYPVGPFCPKECNCDDAVGDYHPSAEIYQAVAEWLDAMAGVWDGGGKHIFGSTEQRALAAMDTREPDPTSLAGRAFTVARLINASAE